MFSANILLIDVCLIRLSRMAGLILLPSFLKAKVPTRHEQAPSYYEKKLLVRSIFMEQALEVNMYTCISVYMYSLTHY